jgi:hypothetical protein
VDIQTRSFPFFIFLIFFYFFIIGGAVLSP